jgi:hypothetical protein
MAELAHVAMDGRGQLGKMSLVGVVLVTPDPPPNGRWRGALALSEV